MNRRLCPLVLLCMALTVVNAACAADAPQEAQVNAAAAKTPAFPASDWPWWRGPQRNGHANPLQQPPLEWSERKNVRWKAPVDGRGHGSATVVGKQVVLPTADEQKGSQSVLAFDRETGKELWRSVVHADGAVMKGNGKATLASSTVACDGERLFINFLNNGGMVTSALDREGAVLWQKRITDYIVHQGYGSSPCIYGSLVIVSADNKGGGAVAALDRVSGETVWKHERPKTPNYSSPIVLNVAGKDQLLLTGCNLVSSYDPLTGEKNWEIAGATTECVTSTVTDGKHIYTTGGFPKNHMAAVRADGSGEVAWQNTTRVYVPSILENGGYLYAVTDNGVAMCFNAATGVEIWKERIGGAYSSSPVLVGDRIYVVAENGKATVFRADPGGYAQIGQGQLGDEVFSTPTIVGSRIYLRVAERVDGKRQEFLYCIGE